MNIEDFVNPLSLDGKCAIAQSCSEEVITWLIHNMKEDDEYTDICENMFDNPNMKPYHMNLMVDVSTTVRWLCAARTEDPELLKEIFNEHDDITTLSSVARNIHTPDYILDSLADNFYTDVVRAVARNPSTSKTTLSRLVNHKDSLVVEAVANNPNTQPEVLLELTNHTEMNVRANVKRNPNTPTIASKVEQALGIKPGQDIVAAIQSLKKARNDAVDALDKVDTNAFNELLSRYINFHEDVIAEIPSRFYTSPNTKDVLASLRAWRWYKPIEPYSENPMDQIMEVIPPHMRKESVVESVKELHRAWAKMRLQMLEILEDSNG